MSEIKKGDFVFPTDQATEGNPDLRRYWRGGKVEKISPDGTAEVHFVFVEKIHISRITNDKDGKIAFNPIL